MFLLKLNSELSTNLMNKTHPLLFTITMIVIIISILRTIIKGDYSNLVVQIIVCSIVAIMVKNPNLFIELGNWLISFGGGLIEE